MGPIKVDRIISISSEEQGNKAENILNSSDPRQTWRCKAGEKQAIVILQFLETSVISSIDIGNNNSAFVEILVGKSTSEEFQVLLVTSSLMTLQECKNGLNLNKVRFFNTDQLSTACNESWDRVKIVCTQPYIKHSSFGLSFITFHSKVVPQIEPVQQPVSDLVQLGLFAVKMDDNQELYAPGKLFDKHNENKTTVDNDTPIQRIIALHKKNLAKEEDCAHKDKPLRKNNNNSHLSSPRVPKTESGKPKDTDSIIAQPIPNKATKRIKSPVSIPCPESDKHSRKKIKLNRKKLVTQRPFNELFKRVIFSMSGYTNPYRSDIRSKALEMGAIYRNNWDKCCTHLICAFKNTPKYQEVKRQGGHRIVTSDWIDNCHENRRRVSWRRFALDKSEEDKSESEDEIHERVLSPLTVNTNHTSSKDQSPSTSQSKDMVHQYCSSIDLSIFDAPTDIDSNSDTISNDILADERSAPLPLLDNLFNGCLFYLSPSLRQSTIKECQRYIIALEGKLSTKENCNYIVSTDNNDLKLKNAVTPQWIWDCYDKRKLLSINYQHII